MEIVEKGTKLRMNLWNERARIEIVEFTCPYGQILFGRDIMERRHREKREKDERLAIEFKRAHVLSVQVRQTSARPDNCSRSKNHNARRRNDVGPYAQRAKYCLGD
jgi:hypothetical protein